MLCHKKECEDDEASGVNMVFIDHGKSDQKSELEFKQTGIPRNDEYGAIYPLSVNYTYNKYLYFFTSQ